MTEFDIGRAIAIVLGWAALGALVTYVALGAHDSGRLPPWLAAIALAVHPGTMPIVAPMALGIDVEMDQALLGVGLFVAALFCIRWALARRAARMR